MRMTCWTMKFKLRELREKQAKEVIMKKKPIIDFCLNIIASGLMTAGLQLIVYPVLAKSNSAVQYGTILTAMGICNTISATFGNSLNNAKLINHSTYLSSKTVGDFNLLFFFAAILCAIVSFLPVFIISGEILVAVLIAASNVFAVARLYYSVSFRIRLNYYKILECNTITTVGYIVGAFIAIKINLWPVAFLLGEILGGLYALCKSGLLEEPATKTTLYKKTRQDYFFLIISTFVVNVGVYLDRFLLFPVLGSESVSVYTTASILGKCIGIVMLPISSVLLSYYAQPGYKMTVKLFYKQASIFVLLAVVVIFALIPISPVFTKILYPTLFSQAKQFIFIANTAAVIGVLGNMLTPAILKFLHSSWQAIIALFYCTIYGVVGYYLARQSGLMGFCIAAIIANSIKCIILALLGLKIKND